MPKGSKHTTVNIRVKICKFHSNFRANLHEYFCEHYPIRHETRLTDREGHRLLADGLLYLLLFHVLFQHLIRSQTVDQHFPAHLPMRFLLFLLGGLGDAQLGKNLLRREEVFRPFLRRELVQFFCFVERVVLYRSNRFYVCCSMWYNTINLEAGGRNYA